MIITKEILQKRLANANAAVRHFNDQMHAQIGIADNCRQLLEELEKPEPTAESAPPASSKPEGAP